jgi:ATP-dependent RNA helicase DeaD
MSFEDTDLDPLIVTSLKEMGYQDLLDVQKAVLTPLREGRDLSVRSKTGTGKTAAFGIPLVEKLNLDHDGPSLLVLAPTRELASQIAADLTAIGKHRGVQVVAAYGGISIGAQISALEEGAHVVVGTPGRLLDLARRRNLKLSSIDMIVLDEADEMLSMGFFEDVTGLMDQCTACSQVVIMSASLNEETQALVDRYTTDVLRVDLSADTLSVDGIDHIFYKIGDDLPRNHYLLHVMRQEEPTSAIIFVNTRKDASLVATQLAREGYNAEMLSGELPQRERERVFAAIKDEKLRFLVATDVAARGIDISHLSHVINHSLPEDPAIYLHRVGRTGRVGRHGTAISLISGARVRTLGLLERQFRIKFEERIFPAPEDMVSERNEGVIKELIEQAEAAICDGFLAQAEAVLEHGSARQLVAFLLKKRADQVHDEKRDRANRPEQRPPRDGGRGGGRGGRPPKGRGGQRGGHRR